MSDVACLLDVDGTLVDSTYIHAVCWAVALRSQSIDIPTARVHRLIGMNGPRLLEELLGKEAAEAMLEPVGSEHDRLFLETRDRVAPLPGARRLLQELAGRGVTSVLVSSASEDEVKLWLDLLDARDLVAGWTSSDDTERSKPDPEPVATARRIGGRDDAVVIGDAPWDCRSASAASLPAVGVLTGGFAATELKAAGAAAVYEDAGAVADDLDRVLALSGRSERRARRRAAPR
jgi:phosphoglycolate phosphatase-like HAD superfamily hydrolase